MKLEALIKESLDSLATATPATTATPKQEITSTVASVATVAVMACSNSHHEQQEDVQEAVEERKAILEYEGNLDRTSAEKVAELAEDFYSHIFGEAKRTHCCYPRSGRYCTEGQRLKDAYYLAVKQANSHIH
ncbi:MAG: hypothetical protein B6D73_14350 [gamma proteobacterium symbiont of Stewartia floridana]|nr:MAG: hypothetical protein B6D73_14350 [gamma proteobacterium symbiont of Stewartia floridana]